MVKCAVIGCDWEGETIPIPELNKYNKEASHKVKQPLTGQVFEVCSDCLPSLLAVGLFEVKPVKMYEKWLARRKAPSSPSESPSNENLSENQVR